MPPQLTKCTATTAKGKPCKAWAIRASNPPLCAPHAGLTGGSKGNQNAVTHGYYRKRIEPDEIHSLYDAATSVGIDQEVILLRVALHRLSSIINDPHISLEEIKSIIPLIVSTSRALAYLKKQLPDPTAIDWDAALDELGKEWGWDL